MPSIRNLKACGLAIAAALICAAQADADPQIAFSGSAALINSEAPLSWRVIVDPNADSTALIEIESARGLIRIPLDSPALDAFSGRSNGLEYLIVVLLRSDEEDAGVDVLFVGDPRTIGLLAAGGQMLLIDRPAVLESSGELALFRLDLAELERLK